MATNILLGIGNPLSGDDGVGIYVAEQFKKEGWISISCGTAPENFTGVHTENPAILPGTC